MPSSAFGRDIGDLVTPENAFDRRREIGVMASGPTNRLTSAAVYELPFGKGKKLASNVSRLTNLLVGGWSLTALFTGHACQFLTPSWTGPDPTGTAYSSSNTPVSVTRRPNELSDPNLPADQRSLRSCFDAAGQFGSAARGVINGPGVNMWNFSFIKDLSRRTHISNTTTVGVISGVGGASSDTAGPRALRMSLRLEF